MDHYKALGVNNNASKEEIKKAFRKLALEFHPDKHSHSSKQLRESATHRFKLISEAYETLIDDVKRADYNIRRDAYNRHTSHYRGNTGYSYNNSSKSYGYGYNGSARKTAGGGGVDAIFSKIEIGLRFVTTKAFILNATLSCIVLGAAVLLDASGPTLWKRQNPGKSFEEAMESLQKSKDNHS